ncbi:hypothetical protein K474DRAFT_1134288 [Panus rudis PR-1116 ss-1]|nr:hypothetical protein K474DRAFT_1134288 [Panus rudis PR-1116 ss-1]
MDYQPRYPQPFTLQQAVQLDVPLITEEIARLQNSLQHLRETQEQLREAIKTDPDPEFTKAIEENEQVIGSQSERISILKMALTEKGIPTSAHYNLSAVASTPSSNGNTQQTPTPNSSRPRNEDEHSGGVDNDGGIDL